jgi:hypothetical protein
LGFAEPLQLRGLFLSRSTRGNMAQDLEQEVDFANEASQSVTT